MDRGLACWVVGLLVVAAVAAPAAGTGAPDGPFGVAQEFDPDDVTLSAALEEDGSAAWSFKYRMELTTENETQAFEELQADIEANRSRYVDRFRTRIESTVASAENVTGRNMSVENVSVRAFQQTSAEFADSYGFVVYTFEWGGFAATDGEQIVAGDSLEGFYLNNETSLQFSWPDGYAATDVDPVPAKETATSVRWSGPADFGTDQPHLVIEPSDATGTTEPTETTAASSGESNVVLPALVGALVAVLVVAGAGWLYFRREGGGTGGATEPTETAGGGGGGGGAGEAATGVEESAEEAGAGAAASAAAGTEPPEELLSNEERVKRFLREQGGRAKQQDVVEAMGWTEAKTSQVVKDMRESDELESFRIGRENVLKLPDADISEE